MNNKKTYLVGLFLILFLTAAGLARAANNGTSSQSGNIDLGIEDVGLLPTNPFYFLKEWSRGVRLFFTFNPTAKTDFQLQVVNEKAAELQQIQQSQPNNERGLVQALKNYQSSVDRLKTVLNNLKDTSQNPNVDKLLNDLAERSIQHENLLNGIADKFKNQKDVQDLTESSKQDLEDVLGQASEKDQPKDFSAKLDKAIKNSEREGLQSGQAKDFLNRLKEKSSEDLKQEIENIPENDLNSGNRESDKSQEINQETQAPEDGNHSDNLNSAGGREQEGSSSQSEIKINSSESAGSGSPDLQAEQPPAQEAEFQLQADDSGFYPQATFTVAKGAKVKINFFVRTSNVYYGGLDFRSGKFSTITVKAGESETVEFTADESFQFYSFWPSSGVLKATGQIIVQ